ARARVASSRASGGAVRRARGLVRGPCPFFFFQAEDGIRDFHVTGVQTCALPISEVPADYVTMQLHQWDALGLSLYYGPNASATRSEERRVGKECRYRGARWQEKNGRRSGERARAG